MGRALDSWGPLSAPAPGESPRHWAPVVERLITQVLEAPLDAHGRMRLRELERGDRLDELEFHFPLERFTPDRLRDVLAGTPFARAGQGLTFQTVRGLMRGFMDLVFRWNGRYYLADYKSNHLGDRLEDYQSRGMEAAMEEHRYGLQCLIYTVALHRYLGRRLAGYQYSSHFGGAYYLFLRGMRAEPGSSTGVWFHRPDEALVDRLDEVFGGVEEGRP